MKRSLSILLCAALALAALAPAARAVDIQRQGSENPVLEVAKSTVWGALGGLVVGGAIALASDSDGEAVRWGFVVGTALGFGYGIYHISSRPKSDAMLELKDGDLRLHAALPVPEPGRGMTLRLVAWSF